MPAPGLCGGRFFYDINMKNKQGRGETKKITDIGDLFCIISYS